jgi:hypothetical protein
MQTRNTNDQPATTGHCVNELTVSGTFLMLAQNGNLMTVTQMIQERARIAADLQRVEEKLLSCNNPLALARYARSCEKRNKDFGTELRRLAVKLETQKCELTLALQQIDEQFAQQNLGFKWMITTAFVSLLPTANAPPDPVVALRYMIIDQNLGKPHSEICQLLDFPWREGESPTGFFPDSWTRDYGVKTFVAAYRHPNCRKRVEPMISKRNKRGP